MTIGQNIKNTFKLIATIAFALFLVNCGSVGPSVPTSEPIGIEFMDASSGISVDSSFTRTFSEPVDSDTVNSDTLFIVEALLQDMSVHPKADDPDCIPANRLPETVTDITTDPNNPQFLMTLDNSLAFLTPYKACQTSGVKNTAGASVAALTSSFTSQRQGQAMPPFLSSLVPAGRNVDMVATPQVATFNQVMDTASVANNVTMAGTRVGNIAFTTTWNTTPTPANHIATFTPTGTSPLCDTVTTTIPGTVVTNVAGIQFQNTETNTFYTLYKYNDDFTNLANRNAFSTCWTTTITGGLPTYAAMGTSGLTFTKTLPIDGLTIGPGAGFDGNYTFTKLINDTTIQATAYFSAFQATITGASPSELYFAFQFDDPIDPTPATFAIGISKINSTPPEIYNCFVSTDLTAASIFDTGVTVGNPCNIADNDPIWFRISRDGDIFTAYYSRDGITYTQLGTPTTVTGITGNYRVLVAPLINTEVMGATYSWTFETLTFE